MTPERMAKLVARWVRFYTRNLPPPIARRRIDEIDADLHDHIAHERARGTGDRRIAFSIAARMIRGLAADVSWRRQTSQTDHRPALRIALAAGFLVLLPFVAMQFTDEVDWGVLDFVSAWVLLAGAGFLFQLAARRTEKIAHLVAAAAIAVAAIALGEADDAPGLVLFGLLVILATAGLAFRRAQRSE